VATLRDETRSTMPTGTAKKIAAGMENAITISRRKLEVAMTVALPPNA
jgi:hypothetical protein